MGITSLTPQEAALIAVSGIVIVFIMLALLAGMIRVISMVLSGIQGKKETAPSASAPIAAASAPAAASEPQQYCGDVALVDVDEKTAACIMAIISDESGIPLSELVFKKIKAL